MALLGEFELTPDNADEIAARLRELLEGKDVEIQFSSMPAFASSVKQLPGGQLPAIGINRLPNGSVTISIQYTIPSESKNGWKFDEHQFRNITAFPDRSPIFTFAEDSVLIKHWNAAGQELETRFTVLPPQPTVDE